MRSSTAPAAEFYARFTELSQQQQLHASLARHWLIGALALDRVLGDYTCGMVALEAFYSDNPEVTVEYIHERIGGYVSDDTIRRRLNQMQKAGALTVRKDGRVSYYRLRPDLAEAAIAMMKGNVVSITKPQNAAKSP